MDRLNRNVYPASLRAAGDAGTGGRRPGYQVSSPGDKNAPKRTAVTAALTCEGVRNHHVLPSKGLGRTVRELQLKEAVCKEREKRRCRPRATGRCAHLRHAGRACGLEGCPAGLRSRVYTDDSQVPALEDSGPGLRPHPEFTVGAMTHSRSRSPTQSEDSTFRKPPPPRQTNRRRRPRGHLPRWLSFLLSSSSFSQVGCCEAFD